MRKLTQEEFDLIVRTIRQQGGPSFDGWFCSYRGDKGRKCAIGALLSDENYDPDMEGVGVRDQYYFKDWDMKMLVDLQSIHDRAACSTSNDADFFAQWEPAMAKFAKEHNFTMPQD